MAGEYRGDFTRDTFDRAKHFLRVLTQQGRVSIDADWNEQTSIVLEIQRLLTRDVFGEHGASAFSAPRGFAITPFATATPQANDFRIGRGRYYVQGVPCEVDEAFAAVTGPTPMSGVDIVVDALTLDGRRFERSEYVEVFAIANPTTVVVARIVDVDMTTTATTTTMKLTLDTAVTLNGPLGVRRITTYRTQPDLRPTQPLNDTGASKRRIVYVDVWERHITHVQDDAIRDVALGAADTATRSKVVWQVRVADLPTADPKNNYDQFLKDLNQQLNGSAPPGRLRVRATPGQSSSDPCSLSPDARYRGIENQLYRVEVHRGGPAAAKNPASGATFKWSRENSSQVIPIASGSGTREVVLVHGGHDDRSALRKGDLVEYRDDTSVSENTVGNLLTVDDFDRVSHRVRLNKPASAGTTLGAHPVLIRWDRNPSNKPTLGSDDAELIDEGTSAAPVWIPLEDGIEIQFAPPIPLGAGQTWEPPARYRTGDYWLIPARTETGDVEWPVERDPQGKPVVVSGGTHLPLARTPHGIEHHYAPLAVLDVDAGGIITNSTDCRWQLTFQRS